MMIRSKHYTFILSRLAEGFLFLMPAFLPLFCYCLIPALRAAAICLCSSLQSCINSIHLRSFSLHPCAPASYLISQDSHAKIQFQKAALNACMQYLNLLKMGFKWDRQWLIVNSKGHMYTQRVEPKLALVEVFFTMEAFTEDWKPTPDAFMTVKAPGMDPLQIPLLQNKCERVDNVSVWEWSGSALDEGSNAAKWFSTYLGKPSHLVRFDTVSEIRPTDEDYARGYKTMFADEYPFLLASQGSLDSLNKHLNEPLPINRFRPNIFVEGCEPFAEDLWKTLRINGLTFHCVKLCSRCKVPTVNQETGIAGNEPTETLSKYRSGESLFLGRKAQKKVFFGQNLICEESLNPKSHVGKVIRVGDMVNVVKKISSSAEAAA